MSSNSLHPYLSLISLHRDAIMGVAILWIMLYHLPFSSGWMPLDIFQALGYGGVDIFVFLSGLGLYFSLSRADASLRSYYVRRFLRILPQFWLVLLVVFVIQMQFGVKDILRFLCCASTLGYWLWLPHLLWYVSFVVMLYALFPAYFSAFRRYGSRVALWGIVAGLLLMIVLAGASLAFFDGRNFTGYLILSFARLPIFFLGTLCGHWLRDEVNVTLTMPRLITIVILSIISIVALIYSQQYLQPYVFSCSLFYYPFLVLAPVGSLLLAHLFAHLPSLVTTTFTKIGAMSFELYLVHEFLFKQHTTISSTITTSINAILSTHIAPHTNTILTILLLLTLTFLLSLLLQAFRHHILLPLQQRLIAIA